MLVSNPKVTSGINRRVVFDGPDTVRQDMSSRENCIVRESKKAVGRKVDHDVADEVTNVPLTSNNCKRKNGSDHRQWLE